VLSYLLQTPGPLNGWFWLKIGANKIQAGTGFPLAPSLLNRSRPRRRSRSRALVLHRQWDVLPRHRTWHGSKLASSAFAPWVHLLWCKRDSQGYRRLRSDRSIGSALCLPDLSPPRGLLLSQAPVRDPRWPPSQVGSPLQLVRGYTQTPSESSEQVSPSPALSPVR
jgi:hypothetical protein